MRAQSLFKRCHFIVILTEHYKGIDAGHRNTRKSLKRKTKNVFQLSRAAQQVF